MPSLMMKILIVGPMDKKHTEDEFFRAERQLILQGYEVFNPFRMPKEHNRSYTSKMIWMLQSLDVCDEVLFLKGSYTELIDELGKTIGFQWHSDDVRIIYLVAKRDGIDILSDELTGEGGHTQ